MPLYAVQTITIDERIHSTMTRNETMPRQRVVTFRKGFCHLMIEDGREIKVVEVVYSSQ